MKKTGYRLVIILFSMLWAHSSWGAQVKAYVSSFTVSGAQNKDELKPALQTLLTSRLNNDMVTTVESPEKADVTVNGSYVVFGKVFSIDAAAKGRTGEVVARAFVQGESQDELIPAIGKLGKMLADNIARNYPQTSALSAPLPAPKASPDIVRKEAVAAPTADIITPPSVERQAGSSLVSQRIKGMMSCFAAGRTLANGEREYFVAGGNTLQYYRKGKEARLVAETVLDINDKILSIDTADLNGDGIPEIYVTVMNNNALVSQVWVLAENGLKKVTDRLPYFFRAIALDGKDKKIYAQQMNIDDDFYGEVFELGKTGESYELKSPLKLPKQAYLYNFNRFTDPKGNSYFVIFNRDGYLLVFSPEGEELWRSSDKFGGSELYYQRSDRSPKSGWTDSRYVFLDPRIFVSKKGAVIVPQNSGFWVVGNSRSYSKNSVYAFTWSGASLEEKWHTRQSQNYLADYSYDDGTNELLLLEVVKKEGLFDNGASAVSSIKIE
ncbi:hypothetical protein OR1_04049 [Geobacter sp. OR-1]|uniref:FG-GAP repeat domain-containing protein n=1 Tax=Geobacter sp. OR-1 TaxID=1266765 RepID=UPI000543D74C|nr:VCBS repeat-containing protein [Geobacter sp. OR-1]GAM11732.1 hypothetical protein OR1_04049 [Geobacter sp. OR-1]